MKVKKRKEIELEYFFFVTCIIVKKYTEVSRNYCDTIGRNLMHVFIKDTPFEGNQDQTKKGKRKSNELHNVT